METLSKTKIDRLGDRLRKGNITDDDLRLLDEYRGSFAEAYDLVVGTVRNELGLEPTGRPAKSTTSINEKLRRESIRLTQIQDIAGCRIVATEISEQERIVAALVELFLQSTVLDRRQKPSHGYRAVHVIVAVDKRAVEIQVRTALQQRWAELSEKLSDLFDPAIKYGGGKADIQGLLAEASDEIAKLERREYRLLEAQLKLERLSEAVLTKAQRGPIMKLQEEAASVRTSLEKTREALLEVLRDAVDRFQE
jgi:putative GTP pyrophosphokinase